MHLLILFLLLFITPILSSPLHLPLNLTKIITPKVFILSMWSPESHSWLSSYPQLTLLPPIPIPGLSPLYPSIHCTPSHSICHATLGEGEINAAISTAALLSPFFSSSATSGIIKLDLRKTYFLLSGIAGVNPRRATIGSVAIARYTVQVALQYEIDARSIPLEEFGKGGSGYFAYGRDRPGVHPSITYGTEVFELNENLRDLAYMFATKKGGKLISGGSAEEDYRKRYKTEGQGQEEGKGEFEAATKPPAVEKCDVATSDVYYSGRILAETFENTTRVWTNGTGEYCMTAQEDNAILGVMVRGAVEGLVDFGRMVVLRSGSNFDRPPPDSSDWQHLALSEQNGFEISIKNIFNAGMPIVQGILDNWNCTFAEGVKPDNYIGDVFGSLGGVPDFGLGSLTGGRRIPGVMAAAAVAAAASNGGGGGGKDKGWFNNVDGELERREMNRRASFGKKALRKI